MVCTWHPLSGGRTLDCRDHKTFDVLISRTGHHPPSPAPVIIGIDDSALARYGQWPWPRHHLARLISRLYEAGVDLVIFDLILFGKDRTSPLTIQEELHQDSGLHLSIENLPADKRDNDRILARALVAHPVVLGYKLNFVTQLEAEAACGSRIDPVLPAEPLAAQSGFELHRAVSMVCSLPELNSDAKGLGFVNALADSDGVLRRVPLIADYQGGIYPGLILAALMTASNNADLSLGRDMDGGFIHLNHQRIPLDPHGHLLLRYRGPRKTFPTFSAAAIIADPLPDLSRRIAIVGPTAPGLGDIHVTPLDRAFPGVEVHATILDNILQNDFLVRPAWARGAESLGVVVAGFLATLIIVVAGPILYMLAIATAALGAWSLSAWMLAGPGCWISPLGVETVLVLNTAVLSLMEYRLKARELHLSTQELVKSQDATILSLTALADVYDALISRRVYKAPLAHEQAVEIIRQGRGTHFDPDVVDAFIENQDQFKTVSARYT